MTTHDAVKFSIEKILDMNWNERRTSDPVGRNSVRHSISSILNSQKHSIESILARQDYFISTAVSSSRSSEPIDRPTNLRRHVATRFQPYPVSTRVDPTNYLQQPIRSNYIGMVDASKTVNKRFLDDRFQQFCRRQPDQRLTDCSSLRMFLVWRLLPTSTVIQQAYEEPSGRQVFVRTMRQELQKKGHSRPTFAERKMSRVQDTKFQCVMIEL